MKKIILIFFLTLLLFPKIVFGKNLIRDAEIEETLRIITAPLLENTKINKENFKRRNISNGWPDDNGWI